MATRTIKVDSPASAVVAAAEAVRALKEGKLVGFPTETVYGVGCLATDDEALGKLRDLKSRPAKPFSIHMGRGEDLGRYIKKIPPSAQRLIRKAWPGPVTVILKAGGLLAELGLQVDGLYEKLSSEDMIAFRVPEVEVTQLMLNLADGPVVATSANPAGKPSPRTAQDVLATMDGKIDLLIDAGPSRYGKDSTIVQLLDEEWEILREGVFDGRTIKKLMKKTVLFICTGNTCRSPIAEGLARKLLAEQEGCEVKELSGKGIDIQSAGLFSMGGSPPPPEAAAAAAEYGADISGHRSQKITVELINGADLIFCMTQFHLDHVLQLVPQATVKAKRLDPDADIPDPIGGGSAIYSKTAEQIGEALKCQIGQGLP